MKNYKQSLGILGEIYACNYLMKKGVEILERRWHFKNKEIDIIARIDKTLIIVEVKTRNINKSENFNEIISDNKIKFLTSATEYYLSKFPYYENVRFDVIIVNIGKNKHEINHIENAFNPY
ncbi:MAG: YraN family protein [Bacteroidales bacterium]|nr:YraN family protein [Bacteroidales bacterium]